jgi:uncharacterized FlaG/YvyC family protein
MDISQINRGGNIQSATVPVIPADRAAENRDIVQAVKAVNGAELFGQDNQLMFQRDPTTQRMVIQMVNRRTKEVVLQIPPEYVLRLAKDLKVSGSGAIRQQGE